MAILDPVVQIKLAKMFDEMWSDFTEGATEELEAYLDSSGLTEEFEATEEDTVEHEDVSVGDVMRRLNDDGHAVVRLADEANKQAREAAARRGK